MISRTYNDHPDLHNEITSVAQEVDSQLAKNPRQFGECHQDPDDPDGTEMGVALEPVSAELLVRIEFELGDIVKVVSFKPVKRRRRKAD